MKHAPGEIIGYDKRGRPIRVVAGGSQDADRIIQLPEISKKTLMSIDTLRWKKHRGELPFLFKLGRRVVAYEHEVDAWIREQRELARSK